MGFINFSNGVLLCIGKRIVGKITYKSKRGDLDIKISKYLKIVSYSH